MHLSTATGTRRPRRGFGHRSAQVRTCCSKSVDAELSQVSLELKVLIEQMREQVQNLE
jgi:hypothetical protein